MHVGAVHVTSRIRTGPYRPLKPAYELGLVRRFHSAVSARSRNRHTNRPSYDGFSQRLQSQRETAVHTRLVWRFPQQQPSAVSLPSGSRQYDHLCMTVSTHGFVRETAVHNRFPSQRKREKKTTAASASLVPVRTLYPVFVLDNAFAACESHPSIHSASAVCSPVRSAAFTVPRPQIGEYGYTYEGASTGRRVPLPDSVDA